METLRRGIFASVEAMVLHILRHTNLVAEAGLAAHLARCEARPAFRRALDAQMAAFSEA